MSSIFQNKIIYSDILSNFNIHPIKKDLVRLTNEEAVKKSIINLIFTNKGERPFQPLIGSSIRQYLFELMSPQVQNDIESEITRVILNFEPRCQLIKVWVKPDYDNQAYEVAIVFSILNRTEESVLNLTLERVR